MSLLIDVLDTFVIRLNNHNCFSRLFWNSHSRKFILTAMSKLPVKNTRVMLISRDGLYFSCNPKSLALKLSEYEFWDVKFGLRNISIKNQSGIEFVQLGTIVYYYYLATSRFFITNERVNPDFTYPFKNKNQIFIHTMHGGHGIKKTPAAFTGCIENVWAHVEDNQDIILSNSLFFTKFVVRKGFHFTKNVLEVGLPRNDIFFSDSKKKQEIRFRVLKQLGLPNEASLKILIYGPTFRYNGSGTSDLYDVDFQSVLGALEKRFGGHWIVAISKHQFLESVFHQQYDFTLPYIIDAAAIEDVQDLLIAGDALITDYSSIEMDFSLTGKPQFQFFVDGKDWEKITYINTKTLPFPYAETNEQLVDAILNFNEKQYEKDLLTFNKETVGLVDDGHACARVVEWMKQQIS